MQAVQNLFYKGLSVKEIVSQGFARSTVYQVRRKLSRGQVSKPDPGVADELVELKYERERLKLEKQIADLVAEKEKLPDRVTALERELQDLRDHLLGFWTDAWEGMLRIHTRCPEHGSKLALIVRCMNPGCPYERFMTWRA